MKKSSKLFSFIVIFCVCVCASFITNVSIVINKYYFTVIEI
jgi:hypothetical protein